MADDQGTITVTLKVSRGMPDAELEELAATLPGRFPQLVRDAEGASGSVSLALLRPRPDAPVEEPDLETRERVRDMVRRRTPRL